MKKVFAYPLFIYLMPLYFYLLGIGNYGLHPNVSKIWIPFFSLLFISLFLHWILQWKSNEKKLISIVFFIALSAYLFFGNIKDAIPKNSLFYSYTFLCPLLILFPIVFFFYLKRKENLITEVFNYLNYLILILLILQLTLSIKKIHIAFQSYITPIPLKSVTIGFKPSIYFILFDEYPGQISLKQIYNDDNAVLLTHLRDHHFFVFDTINSNYDKTVYSINSTFNLQYIDQTLYQPVKSYQTYLKNFSAIKNNLLAKFLQKQGYQIHNLSLFDINHLKSPYRFPLLLTSNEPLTRNMFHNRIVNDLLWKLYCGKTRIESIYDKYLLHTHHQNNEIIEKTIQESKRKHEQPILLFSHLLLPHEPYFTDSTGRLYDMEHEVHVNDNNQKSHDYLKYANKRMIQMADSILKNDPESIIILMSDHGYRDTPDEYRNFNCNNFMAMHLPDTNYSKISQMRSNVNLFRILLDQYFKQDLPLLSDSCYTVDEINNCFKKLKPF